MTSGQDLMQKYPIGVTERIAKEIDDAISQAVEEDRNIRDHHLFRLLAIYFAVGVILGLVGKHLLS